MAGRKDKNTVDYFPHYCVGGKTMYIIENKFGNDGYAVWYKLLELLGSSDNHYLDCRNTTDWEFLTAKMRIDSNKLQEILDTLAHLGAIHEELWQNKVIWSGNFIKNISDAYVRRNNLCMHFYDLCKHLSILCIHKYTSDGIYVDENTQSKLEYTKLDKTKVEREVPPPLSDVADYCKERNNGIDPERWFDFYSSKGWKIGNVPMKDWRASVRTWEKRELKTKPKQMMP
jgi:hypothetical protein